MLGTSEIQFKGPWGSMNLTLRTTELDDSLLQFSVIVVLGRSRLWLGEKLICETRVWNKVLADAVALNQHINSKCTQTH